MLYLKSLLLLSASFALITLGLVSCAAISTLLQARSVISETHSLVRELHQRTVDTFENLNAILLQTGLAADEFHRAASEQRHYWNQSGRETVQVLKDSDHLVRSLTQTNQRVYRSVALLTGDADRGLVEIPRTLTSSQKALNSVSTLLSDPHLAATLTEMDQTMVHTEKTAEHLEATTATVDKKVQEWARPTHWFKALSLTTIQWAGALRALIF